MKKLLSIIVVILISDLVFSQTLSLPIQTKYQDENAVIISETQMDFISRAILERNALRRQKTILNLKISALLNELEQEKIKYSYLESDINNLKAKNNILAKQVKLCETYEIPKTKSAKPIKKFLLGFCAGVLITSAIVIAN